MEEHGLLVTAGYVAWTLPSPRVALHAGTGFRPVMH